MIRCLAEAKEDRRRGAMRFCSWQMCDSMSEIAANLFKGNIPLTDHPVLGAEATRKGHWGIFKKEDSGLEKEGDLTERRLPQRAVRTGGEIFDASCQTCCEKPDTIDCGECAGVIVYWTYLCVFSLESPISIVGSACSSPRGSRACPLRHRISPLSPQSIGSP